MYQLTQEDVKILETYRTFLEGQVAEATNPQVKMILGKSVELLSGEITTQTLVNYLEVQVKKNPDAPELSDEAKAKVNEIRIAASQHGVMDVVKRFKQGSK